MVTHLIKIVSIIELHEFHIGGISVIIGCHHSRDTVFQVHVYGSAMAFKKFWVSSVENYFYPAFP